MTVSLGIYAALLQAAGSRQPLHAVGNIFEPLATPAAAEYNLALFVLAITAVIFLIVAGLLIYIVVRFRRRPEQGQHEPPQVYGSSQIEVAWTVIPLLIVFILIGVTARVVASLEDAAPGASAAHVTLVGHQWWWEVHYPDLGVVSANEIHVPTAGKGERATYLDLESDDVIHSFWVPQLSGKVDLIPNRTNHIWIDPREPGIFLGNCAEYCGTQHANMLLRVVVDAPVEFAKWAASQKQTAAAIAGGTAFQSLACVNCHTVRGTAAAGKFGPDLTHLMSRSTLGAGVIPNNLANLKSWVNDPQAIKPGCLMPSLKLTDSELNQVVTYLASLQ